MVFMTIFTTPAIARIAFLERFLDADIRVGGPQNAGGGDYVAGWGAKRSGRRAEAIAAQYGLAPLFLEDGFLRSFGTGDRFPPLSLVVDQCGIYYDSTRPSTLEHLLNSNEDLLTGIEQDVAIAHALILEHRLGKYNHAPLFDASRLRSTDKERVLVVDQTFGDHSIALGGASPDTFADMLKAARAENPDATLYVKTHPEVSSGRKRGHYADVVEGARTVLLRDAANPLSLIEHMDKVYVVSSTMGFEALLAGKPVSCFGLPWYAGWGATDDRLSCSRRKRTRSVIELFAAGYFHYARYLDPVTHKRGTIFDVIEWLVRQRTVETHIHGEDFSGRLICVGFRRWKQANITSMLGLSKGGVQFVRDMKSAQALAPCGKDQLVFWGTTPPSGLEELSEQTGAGMTRMEDGFVRSVGLGSDLIPPLSLVLDTGGIYFDPRQPSALEHLLAEADFSDEELENARLIRALIVDQGITKYNLEPRETVKWGALGRQVIFVPGQVEDDASIRFGCSTVRTNIGLLESARADHPDDFIVYKPHPDVMSGNRKGKLALDAEQKLADHIETHLSVISCIEACDVVHTMTSLSGFDALLRGKRVITYGQPFYAGWGLTEDRDTDGTAFQRRSRTLSLDELVAGALLRYPLYWDDELRGYTSCQAVLQRIVETRGALEAAGKLGTLKYGFVRRQWRKAKILARAWRPDR